VDVRCRRLCGDLEIRTDRTFTLSYDELTIRYRELGSTLPDPDIVLVVAGEVSGAFELEGNVFLAGDINDPPLAILRSLSGGGYAELPPIIRGASLRMGTRANHPYYMEKITIDCDQDRLVVNDEVRIDPLTGDGPSTIWLRDRTEP
jgi:hypothetical protein